MLAQEDSEREAATSELQTLREKARKLEEEAKKARDLEKKCRMLEETIKARNPNSIPMMLQQVKDSDATEKAEVKELKQKVK